MGQAKSSTAEDPTPPRLDLLGEADGEYMRLKTAAIIVSICSSSSYDSLFTSVKQKSFEGTKTLVFAGNGTAVNLLIQGF